jgi:hypothetical protein
MKGIIPLAHNFIKVFDGPSMGNVDFLQEGRTTKYTEYTENGALRLCASVSLCLSVNPSGAGELVPCILWFG